MKWSEDDIPEPFANLKQLVLEKVKVGVSHRISREMADSLNATAYAEVLSDSIILAFVAKLVGSQPLEDSRVESVLNVPVDWYQALRERWFPKWWLDRHPVKTREIATVVLHTSQRICPHLNYGPGKSQHLNFLQDAEGDASSDMAKMSEFMARNPIFRAVFQACLRDGLSYEKTLERLAFELASRIDELSRSAIHCLENHHTYPPKL